MEHTKLVELGFIKYKYNSLDNDLFYYVKHVPNHSFLKGLHVIIDAHITVWCYEALDLKSFKVLSTPRRKNIGTNDVAICMCDKTWDNLNYVLKWLNSHC